MPNYQTEQDKAILSQRRGKLAAGIKDPQARKSYIAAQSKVDQNGNDSAQAALAESTNKDEQDRVLGSFKKGGTVKKTGLYKMHKGEAVIPAKKATEFKNILSGEPIKGHKPDGAHGRVAVAELGRKKTTGNFKRLEKSKGKGAAIAAFQNAKRAHDGK
jgi:hypothetical protein